MCTLCKNLFYSHKSFVMYGLISVFVTVIDVVLCRACEGFLTPVVSNTVGVVTGFVIQYFLTSRHVYNSNDMKTFLIFLITFFMGLILANTIVWFAREVLFGGYDSLVVFLISKGFSVVIPFFAMYFLRKTLIEQKK